jgi:hypothetical protein
MYIRAEDPTVALDKYKYIPGTKNFYGSHIPTIGKAVSAWVSKELELKVRDNKDYFIDFDNELSDIVRT